MAVGRRRSERQRDRQRQQGERSFRSGLLRTLAQLVVLEEGELKLAALLVERLSKASAPLRALDVDRIALYLRRGSWPREIWDDMGLVAQLATAVLVIKQLWYDTEKRKETVKNRLVYTGLLDEVLFEEGDDPKILKPTGRRRGGSAFRRLLVIAHRRFRKRRLEAEYCGEALESFKSFIASLFGTTVAVVSGWFRKKTLEGMYYQLFISREGLWKAEAVTERRMKSLVREMIVKARVPAVRQVKKVIFDRRTGTRREILTEEPEPLAPTFRGGHGYYGGKETQGWRWNYKIDRFFDWSMMARIEKTVLGIDVRFLRRIFEGIELDLWSTFLVCSVLMAPGQVGFSPTSVVRYDLSAQYTEDKIGERFHVKNVLWGGAFPTRRQTLDDLIKKLCELQKGGALIFVHGLVAWNYRKRAGSEMSEEWQKRQRARLDGVLAQTVPRDLYGKVWFVPPAGIRLAPDPMGVTPGSIVPIPSRRKKRKKRPTKAAVVRLATVRQSPRKKTRRVVQAGRKKKRPATGWVARVMPVGKRRSKTKTERSKSKTQRSKVKGKKSSRAKSPATRKITASKKAKKGKKR